MDAKTLLEEFRKLQSSWRDRLPKKIDSETANQTLDLAFDAYSYARLHGAGEIVAVQVGDMLVDAIVREFRLGLT